MVCLKWKCLFDVWWMFPVSPAESRRGLPQGSDCWRWKPGYSVGPLSWTTSQQPYPARWRRLLNCMSLRSGGQQLFLQLWWQHLSAVYARMDPYLVQSWIVEDYEGTWFMKELWLQIRKLCGSFLKSHSEGGDMTFITFIRHEQHPAGCYWAQS